ncbi:MAG: hypothetical protein JW841_17140 [Deltaproteobacteria bacterium]|nr:hypothetical protein [Deltaproteobacteria bacterium]
MRSNYDSRVDTIPLSPRVAVSFDIIPELTAKYIFSKAFVGPAPYYSHSVAETERAIRYFEEQRNWPWEINLNSTYTPYPNLNLLLTFRNLTNHLYAAKALYSSETGDAQVKEGISVLIGVQYIITP